jgi:cysteinyl-tRNA synthetase
MSGQDILIEQLREELEKAHAASEYQTRRIEHYRTQIDFCERRAEKAERERDEWKARHDTLADVSRKCIATAERERDEARAERDARPDISAEDARAFMMFKPVPARDSREGPVMHALRAHAAKAVNP